MKRRYTVFGSRSGPLESRVQSTLVATGNVAGAKKPPSLDTMSAVAVAGGFTSSFTCGSFVYWAPELIETPRSEVTPTGSEILSDCVSVLDLPVPSVTCREIGTVAGPAYAREVVGEPAPSVSNEPSPSRSHS